MKNFISIVIDNDGINESRDFVLDTVLNTANIGLLENTMEYEIYESENNTQVLSIPIARELNEKQQAYLAKKLANKMFDKGYDNFDIEFSLSEATLNEAAPTTFTPTHYGGPGGLNNVMLHTDGNLYFQRQNPDNPQQREIVRWNGNPTGEGFFGRWNPATIKGTIVNGERVPYPSGTNFTNAPRTTAPAGGAAAATTPAATTTPAAASTTPTGGLLRRGNRGEEVKQLQRDLGMTGDEIDGIFGPATERAVRTFQQTSGSKVDGLVGPETRAAIAKYQGNDDDNSATTDPDAAIDNKMNSDNGIDPNAPIDGGIAPGTTTGGPSRLKQRQQAAQDKQRDDQRTVDVPGGAAPEAEFGAGAPVPAADVAGDVAGEPSGRLDTKGNTPPPNDPAPQGELDATDTAQTGSETIKVTTQDQANSILQNPDSTDAERQAAREFYREFYGETPNPVEFDDLGTAMTGREEVQPGEQVVIDGEEATVVTNDNDQKYYVDTNGQPIGELPQPDAQTSVDQPGGDTSSGDTSSGDPGADVSGSGPEGNRQAPGGLGSAQGPDTAPNVTDDPANRDAARVARELEAWREQFGSSTTGYLGLPPLYASTLEAAQDLTPESARKLKDDSVNAPQAVAVIVLGELRRQHGIDLDADVYKELMIMRRQIDDEDPEGAEALTTLALLARDLEKKVNPDQSNESVEPMPKGAFMVEDRAIWRSLYESTHYTNGKPRPKTFITESKIQEVTFDDDDKFFEAYGVMWFNEDEAIDEAEYQGRKVKLGKPMAGDVKKFKVYVKNPKGNVVKVNFGQKGAKIKKNNPERRRSFRARHNCDNPGPRHKARYWSCRKW